MLPPWTFCVLFCVGRDSKDPDGQVLAFTRSEVRAWLTGARAGEFYDLSVRDTASGRTGSAPR
jgi:hypothetical protein